MMTKSQIVAHLAEKVGIPKKTAVAVLVELVTLATKEAKSSGQFVVPGLGKAVKANRKARTGRNPQTGEAIRVALVPRQRSKYLERVAHKMTRVYTSHPVYLRLCP
jgi:DNA-binding protein HU-beta